MEHKISGNWNKSCEILYDTALKEGSKRANKHWLCQLTHLALQLGLSHLQPGVCHAHPAEDIYLWGGRLPTLVCIGNLVLSLTRELYHGGHVDKKYLGEFDWDFFVFFFLNRPFQ